MDREWETVLDKCDLIQWDHEVDEFVIDALAEDPLDERELYFLMGEE